MAYAAVVSLAQTIGKLLQIQEQDSTFLHQKQQIKCLREKVIFLQAYLDDFPEKLANNLEVRIRDAANEAEDIIESFMSKEIARRLRDNNPEKASSSEGEICALPLDFDFQSLNQELGEVTEEIDSTAEEVMEIKNSDRLPVQLGDSSQFATPMSHSLTSTNKDVVVGFEDDLLAIKTRLCGESVNLQIIPIFGMGGIGKTTLARKAYDEQLTVEHFDIRAWVTVSQDHSAGEIFASLLASLKVEISISGERKNSTMAEKVYKSLKGWRYLIVMDDMWSTKAWDAVKMYFPDDHNGSRILLTTRLSDVATYPDSCSPLHKMRFMDADQSWNLLKHKVFARENCPPELENIGREIARSCRGLPLAIVVVAGLLLKASKTQASWENIARNVNLAINSSDGDQLMKILSLSYNHLPHHLRPCLLYMGSFPEDYKINVSKLIKLWVAEGFLKPSVSKSFEEVAEDCLEDLIKRSLVMVNKRKCNGKTKTCSLHDLVRDLCIKKAHEEKFLLGIMDRYLPEGIKNNHLGSSTIRTACFLRNERSLQYYLSCRLLRTLDMIDAYVMLGGERRLFQLPTLVYEKFHLRYLACDYPPKIPTAISNLQYLQTLILHSKQNIQAMMVRVSPEIWRLPNLRHLVSFCLASLPDPKGAAFALQNLNTLLEVTNFICTEGILRMIPNLKKLGLFYVGNEYVEDYKLDNLVFLHHLEKLRLKVRSEFRFRQLNPVFPASLKKLTLSGTGLVEWEDMGRKLGLLPNLEVLKLRCNACNGSKWETTEGEFLQLKFLLIHESYLEQWITESSHFPSLNCLVLKGCLHLSGIPDGVGEIPTLEMIEVDDVNKSLVDSAQRIQEEQEENLGTDAFRVRYVRYEYRTDYISFCPVA